MNYFLKLLTYCVNKKKLTRVIIRGIIYFARGIINERLFIKRCH